MANDLDHNPWVLDTPATITLDLFHVKTIRWVSTAAAAGDQCLITDPAGTNKLWDSRASGANFVDDSILEEVWPNGFRLLTLTSGLLYVTYRTWP